MKVITCFAHVVFYIVTLSINSVLPTVGIHVRRKMIPRNDTQSNRDSDDEFDKYWNGDVTKCHPTTTLFDETIQKCVALPCQSSDNKIVSSEIVTNEICDDRTTTWDSAKSMCMPQQTCTQLPFTSVNILYQEPQPIDYNHKPKHLPSDLVVGDINNDGVDDVVFSSLDVDGEYWINIHSNFRQVRRFSLIKVGEERNETQELALADLDGDGYLDLIIATVTGIYYVLKPGDLDTEIDINIVHNRGQCQGVAVADMDGDGILDIASSWRQRAIWLFRGEVDALSNFRGFSETEEVMAEDTPPCGVHSIIATDVNEDNMIDLVVGGDEFPLSFLTDEKATKCFMEEPQCRKFLDCNWDNDLAVCLPRKMKETYTCFHRRLETKGVCSKFAECVWNREDNVCEEKPWTMNFLAENETISSPIDCENDHSILPRLGTRYFCANDFNNDGIIDLVSTFKWEITSSLSMYLGGQRSNFEKTWDEKIAVTGYDDGMFGLVCADFDNDGHIDMAVTNRVRAELLLFKNYGEGIFSTPQLIDIGLYGCEYPGELAVGDIDGDNKPDLSIPCQRSGNVIWLKNEDNLSPQLRNH